MCAKDNKKLCLNSGEIIKLSPVGDSQGALSLDVASEVTTMMFEVEARPLRWIACAMQRDS